ncbi:hypothetical protein PILCRDRAFT_86646 [Piloderma croceum F 1598]|uniref:Uncharacterized protein n=1 Tax=Piloderma croceum (strain F 1598) TaxID=765440 RepID=A0A0C3FPC4_PILCF|nr:hypothetical protein PILCRDRAFT_86646 [Piloderma croceum F 1598]
MFDCQFFLDHAHGCTMQGVVMINDNMKQRAQNPNPSYTHKQSFIFHFLPVVGSFMLSSKSKVVEKSRGSSGAMGRTTKDWRDRNGGGYHGLLDNMFRSDNDEDDGGDHKAISVDSGGDARGTNPNSNPGPSYPGVSGGDPILWSKWDTLVLSSFTPHTTTANIPTNRRILFLSCA